MNLTISASDAVTFFELSSHTILSAVNRERQETGEIDDDGLSPEQDTKIYYLAKQIVDKMKPILEEHELRKEFNAQFQSLEGYKHDVSGLFKKYGEPSEDEIMRQYKVFRESEFENFKQQRLKLSDPGRAI